MCKVKFKLIELIKYSVFIIISLIVCNLSLSADNLTIIIVENNTYNIKVGQESLSKAFENKQLKDINKLEIIAGDIEASDWEWLKENKKKLENLSNFTIGDGMDSVADIPNTESQYFGNSLKHIEVYLVKNIGINAFHGCPYLITAKFPNATNIGRSAFSNCKCLSSLYFPDVINIEDSAFYACKILTTIAFPNTLKISNNAFSECKALNLVSLPRVSEIKENAFYNCISLAAISLPSIPPTIANQNSFLNCQDIRTVIFIDKNGEILTSLSGAYHRYISVVDDDPKDNLWYGWRVISPEMQDNANLSIKIVSKSSTTIKKLFSSLEEILSENELKSIFEIEILEGNFESDDWEWLKVNKDSLRFLEKFVISEKIKNVANIPNTKIGFPYFNTRLKTLILANVNQIGDDAFNGCYSLKNIHLPNVINIGKRVFYNCSYLDSVNLPLVESIGDNAFALCIGLRVIELPKLINLENGCFNNCASLSGINLNFVTELKSSCFANCTNIESIFCPKVLIISDSVFYNCSSLKEVIFPNLKSIGNFAFSECKALLIFKFPEFPPSVSNINAFQNCSEHRTIEFVDTSGIPISNVGYIKAMYQSANDGNYDDNLWYGCIIRTITASLSIDGIDKIYLQHSSLKNIIMQVEIEKIDSIEVIAGDFIVLDWLFLKQKINNLESLENFSITENVDTVYFIEQSDENPFFNSAIEKVSIVKLDTLASYIFSNCINLKNINLPNIKVIKKCAFLNCKSLDSVEFQNVEQIEPSAFGNCSSLNIIKLPKVKTFFHYDIFSNCENIQKAYLPTTPPIVKVKYKISNSLNCRIILTNENGNMIEDDSIYFNAYRLAEDGNIYDDFWFGWNIPYEELAGNLNVNIWTKHETYNKINQSSLSDALDDLKDKEITKIEITSGNFNKADWIWLKDNNQYLKNLKYFIISDSINSVADIPNRYYNEENYFGNLLDSVYIAKLDLIGAYAFSYLASLRVANFPDVKYIDSKAFEYCKSLHYISFPNLIEIAECAFCDTRIYWLDLPKVKSIGSRAFKNSTSMVSIKIPNVENIYESAFEYCPKIISVALPKIKKLSTMSFNYCNNLSAMYLPETPPLILKGSYDPFSNCANPKYLYFVDSLGKELINYDSAYINYKIYNDGNTQDNLWYGWIIPEFTKYDEANDNEINIYPNPAGNILFIENCTSNYNLSIYNSLGVRVINQLINSKYNNVDINFLTAGLYYIKIGSTIKKFIKL